MSLDNLQTEARNPASIHLDEMSPLEIVRLMNGEDKHAVEAVASQADVIARAIEIIAERLGRGGRLVYGGAGTSGRLGMLDATECPPTFNSPPAQVVGIIAGGPGALTRAVEGAEDHPEYGECDLKALIFSDADVFVGIATSGRTPYVLGAADYARSLGAATIGLACNTDSELEAHVDLMICPVVGPEVLSGSTRLKAGTATKLVLNMLTTGAMVRLGKCYGNLMVDLRATNTKLKARTNRIVRILTGIDHAAADALLQSCGGELKTALVVQLSKLTSDAARQQLRANNGRISDVLQAHRWQPVGCESSHLVLGIDGGGSSTVALLSDGVRVVGRGEAGPSNIQAVGETRAFASLDAAITAAFASANRPVATVRAVCFGLAGADRADARDAITAWANRRRLAKSVSVVADAEILLAAGTPDGWGVALVAGTGSIAFGRTPDGRTARAGGWGYLLGDEGSGYAMVVAALKAVAHSTDGRAVPTALTATLLDAMNVRTPIDLIPSVYRGDWDRAKLATLAGLVLAVAEAGDPAARLIAAAGADALAQTVLACAHSLDLKLERLPLAVSGGALLGSDYYRGLTVEALGRRGVMATPLKLIVEPADGAVKLAANLNSI